MNFSGLEGLDKLIHKLAGEKLDKKLSKVQQCDIGECIITKGYNLPVKNIVHTVIPKWKNSDLNESELLYLCYKNSIDMAVENGNRSIAFPTISTGEDKFPINEISNISYYIAWRMIKKYTENDLRVIYFSCSNKSIYEKYKELSEDYQDIEFSEEMFEQYKKMDKYSRKDFNIRDFIVKMGIENTYKIFLLKEAFLGGKINVSYIEDTVKVLKNIFNYIRNMTKSFNEKIYIEELDQIEYILKEIYHILDYDTIENAEKRTKEYFVHASDYIFDKINDSLKY